MAEAGVLSSVDVANMLNDWYVMMKKREIQGAIQLKKKTFFKRLIEWKKIKTSYFLLSTARVPF
ncbi:hypothetical protein BsIDN1_67630 [Bacillus safensis]|uniref:Uncharacterized protein n=1 Tax=Bacillus safensis TaxID=561879 RepID=A0A5S9MK48_BACIA|nr:hypothetical protein BsIDN1_67630 [Bacillus safensis]